MFVIKRSTLQETNLIEMLLKESFNRRFMMIAGTSYNGKVNMTKITEKCQI